MPRSYELMGGLAARFLRATTEAFDLIVLDLGLPGRNGLDLLAAIRDSGGRVPVIVLTARDTIADRVGGLDAGADHYLVKPFAFAELLARIRALVRRTWRDDSVQLSVGPLSMDVTTRRVTRGREFG